MIWYILTGVLAGGFGGLFTFRYAVLYIDKHYDVTPKE